MGLRFLIGLSRHNAFERLLSQHRPVSILEDEEGFGRQEGHEVGQSDTRALIEAIMHSF